MSRVTSGAGEKLAVNSTTIFALPPFRHPTRVVRNKPLRLSKGDEESAAAIDRLLRNRTFVRDFGNEWVWSHPSTAKDALRPFPSQIPCPRGLGLRSGSPASLLCNSSLSPPEIPFYPMADPSSTTYQRLLGLETICEVSLSSTTCVNRSTAFSSSPRCQNTRKEFTLQGDKGSNVGDDASSYNPGFAKLESCIPTYRPTAVLQYGVDAGPFSLLPAMIMYCYCHSRTPY